MRADERLVSPLFLEEAVLFVWTLPQAHESSQGLHMEMIKASRAADSPEKKKVVLSNFQFAIFSWFSLENKAWAIMACHCCPEEMLSLLAFVNGTKYERAGLHPCKGCLWALFHGIPTASCLSSHLGTNSLCAFLRTVGFFQPALPCWYWLCSCEANF